MPEERSYMQDLDQDIEYERYRREYLCDPVISDELRLNEMHRKVEELHDQIGKLVHEKEILIVKNTDTKKINEELTEENRMLKIEVEKIHSRFEILDL
jgi:excinuclease UvrABC helicase subunit UvrB